MLLKLYIQNYATYLHMFFFVYHNILYINFILLTLFSLVFLNNLATDVIAYHNNYDLIFISFEIYQTLNNSFYIFSNLENTFVKLKQYDSNITLQKTSLSQF